MAPEKAPPQVPPSGSSSSQIVTFLLISDKYGRLVAEDVYDSNLNNTRNTAHRILSDKFSSFDKKVPSKANVHDLIVKVDKMFLEENDSGQLWFGKIEKMGLPPPCFRIAEIHILVLSPSAPQK